jgi:hypothetical protein
MLRENGSNHRETISAMQKATHREADVLGKRTLRDVSKRLVGAPALHVFGHLGGRPVPQGGTESSLIRFEESI